MIYLLLLAILLPLLPWALMIRIQRVYEFRINLLEQINVASQVDINRDDDWRWRYKIYDQVTFEDMLWRFWRPLEPEIWFADTSFLDHRIKGPQL